MSRSIRTLAAAALVAVMATACSVNAPATAARPAVNGGDACTAKTREAPKSKPKVSTLKGLAGATPPSGATSRGPTTRPTVGAVTVPIENTEVYVIAVDAFGTGKQQEVSWAHVEQGFTYLWLTAQMTCSDGSEDPEGSFLLVVNDDGTGTYLFSLGGCPSSDLFGCDFDASGIETTCGACTVEGEAIACVVAE